MPKGHQHYRRPNGGQLDDSQRLASLAALLAANPKLKPTTAIRSLGVDNPADIRRLRDKFRIEQSKLMADAHRATRSNGARLSLPSSPAIVHALPAADHPERPTPQAHPRVPVDAPLHISPAAVLVHWYELGFGALSTAVEAQSALTQCWLGLPAVSMAVRGQLSLGAIGVAIYTRNKNRPLFLH